MGLSKKLMPQLFSLAVYCGLKTKSHSLAGIGVSPKALATCSVLMASVLMPQKYGTAYLLPGSTWLISFSSSGSMLL